MHGRVWINFKELRAKLKFEDVLCLYHVEVKRDGSQHQGPCPLPLHVGPKGPTAFSANLDRGIFQCFGCKAKGNVLDFACLMENANPADGNALRKVALKLQETFFAKGSNPTKKKPAAQPPSSPEPKVLVNEPLDFELKDLDPEHPYLLEHCCLIPETIQYFGLGYCSRGMLKGRIAIPLHDSDGRLIGYAGVLVDEVDQTEASPTLFPAKRDRNRAVLDFDRTLFVYNGHRITRPVEAMIVVEDFRSAWWLHQNGFGNVVALMDSSCSEAQGKLIAEAVNEGGRVWVISETQPLSRSVFDQIGKFRFTRWLQLEAGHGITDLTGDQIENRLQC